MTSMNNRYVSFKPYGLLEPVRPVRFSELPNRVWYDKFTDIYYELAPLKLYKPMFVLNHRGSEARNSAGHLKICPRGGRFYLYNDRAYAKTPWQHIAKLHWRHSGKAKTFAHRTARRKAKILLQQDPEGDTNFKVQFGLTNWAFS